MITPSPQELLEFPQAKLQAPIVIPKNSLYAEVQIPWAVLAPEGKCD
jgi:hypothetical protein